jgi:hypothetical protein
VAGATVNGQRPASTIVQVSQQHGKVVGVESL